MAHVWLLIEVEDSILRVRPLGDGVRLRFIVSPRLTVVEEPRTKEEVIFAASDSGLEVYYSTAEYPGVSSRIWRQIELAILSKLRQSLGRNVRNFDVSITPLARMTKY